MPIVSDYIRDLIGKQIKEHGIVVWFDPERHYENFVSELSIPYTKVVCYSGSFFGLRREIEPMLEGTQSPRLVVYVPLDQAVAHHALAEVEAAGVVLHPGQQPPTRNTRLSVVARNATETTHWRAGCAGNRETGGRQKIEPRRNSIAWRKRELPLAAASCRSFSAAAIQWMSAFLFSPAQSMTKISPAKWWSMSWRSFSKVRSESKPKPARRPMNCVLTLPAMFSRLNCLNASRERCRVNLRC